MLSASRGRVVANLSERLALRRAEVLMRYGLKTLNKGGKF